jgi:hypothetical protein
MTKDRPAAEAAGRTPKRKRVSKRALRALAWLAGTASFLSPWAVLGLAPRPSTVTSTPVAAKIIIRHRVVRRVIWQKAPATGHASVRYVYVSGGGGGGAPVSTGGSAPPP